MMEDNPDNLEIYEMIKMHPKFSEYVRVIKLLGQSNQLMGVLSEMTGNPNQTGILKAIVDHIPIDKISNVLGLLQEHGLPQQIGSCLIDLHDVKEDQLLDYLKVLIKSDMRFDKSVLELVLEKSPLDRMLDMLRYISYHGARFDDTGLFKKVVRYGIPILNFCMDHGMMIGGRDIYEPIFREVPAHKQIEIFEFLFRNGVQPSSVDLFAMHHRLDLVKLMLEHGANPNDQLNTQPRMPKILIKRLRKYSRIDKYVTHPTIVVHSLLNRANSMFIDLLLDDSYNDMNYVIQLDIGLRVQLCACHFAITPDQMQSLIDHGFRIRVPEDVFPNNMAEEFQSWNLHTNPAMLDVLLPHMTHEEINRACQFHWENGSGIETMRTFFRFGPDVTGIIGKFTVEMVQACVDCGVNIGLPVNVCRKWWKRQISSDKIEELVNLGPRGRYIWIQYYHLLEEGRVDIVTNNEIARTCCLPVDVYRQVLLFV